MPDLGSFGLLTNLAIFAAAACVVWVAGTKIAGYADEISQRTGLGEALIGVLLLAGATSLPEIATSITAAVQNTAVMGVNNLLGSIAMQIVVLAVADQVYHKRALTSVVPDPVVILQGSLNVCLLSLTAIAAVVGDVAFLGAGAWTWFLLVASLYCFKKLHAASGRHPWIAQNIEEETAPHEVAKPPTGVEEDSNLKLGVKTTFAALAILAGGAGVAMTAEGLAAQSGLGESFMGMAFVALTTSLPEVSTVFAAVRRGLYTMAISDILGTNIINVALIFAVDAVSSQSPVMSRVGDFSAVGAMLGVVVTGIFLVGLAERRDRTVWKMGVDSAAVIVVYCAGLGLLFTLRG